MNAREYSTNTTHGPPLRSISPPKESTSAFEQRASEARPLSISV